MSAQDGLALAFADFAALPSLLDLAGADGTRAGIRRWAEFLREAGASLDHVEDGPAAKGGDPHQALAEDAWSLCQTMVLLSEKGTLTREARGALASDSPEEALAGHLERRIDEGWRVGKGRGRVAPLLVEGAKRVRNADPILGSGLLLCEMALLVAAARRGEASGMAALDRIMAHRRAATGEMRKRQAGAEKSKKPKPSRIGQSIAFAEMIRERCLADERSVSAGRRPMGLTEARATAMLLVFSGFFDEAFPLGPTNCMTPRLEEARPGRRREGRAPVLANGGALWDADVDMVEAAALTFALLEHNKGKAVGFVYSELGLDRAARAAADAVPPPAKARATHEWGKSNKALALELLVSEMLAGFGPARVVHAQFATRNGHPFRHAGPGESDIEVEYPDREVEPPFSIEFSIVAEVSARRGMDAANLREQMQQALDGRDRLKRDRPGDVYALAVNDGRIATDLRLRKAYRDCVEANRDKFGPGDGQPLVPICGLDLAKALEDIDQAGGSFAIGTQALFHTLVILSGLLLDDDERDGDWMRDMLAQAHDLGLQPPGGDLDLPS
ncbi:MAG: hypothetical protein OXJ53_13005 [Gammaproteobacteria bacterium]|nr:hypothetical protein [Gammaproteobacteria bacterium]MDE0272889.1 hypothetical protein [Gammaproteobacteria bacterium]